MVVVVGRGFCCHELSGSGVCRRLTSLESIDVVERVVLRKRPALERSIEETLGEIEDGSHFSCGMIRRLERKKRGGFRGKWKLSQELCGEEKFAIIEM